MGRLAWYLLLLIPLIEGKNIDTVIQTACQRNPNLPYCTLSQSTPSSSASPAPELSPEDRKTLLELSLMVNSLDYNPFDGNSTRERLPRGTHIDEDLHETEISDDAEGFIPEESSSGKFHNSADNVHDDEDTEESPQFKGGRDQYCDKYEQHYSFYCVGDRDTGDESAASFCPSYKLACPNKAATSTSLTTWPADPFSSHSPHTHPAPAVVEEDSDSEEDEVDRQQAYNTELRKRFPCKPDCDQRLFPHCTAECKCDWIYPVVQKFCNPPPMPMFLNTCRLWYNGCPKYDQYHYSSQFVYSKAEKGKVLPGPRPYNPYNIPQPTATGGIIQGAPSAPRSSSRGLIPIARGAPTLVIPPDLPASEKLKDEAPRAHSMMKEDFVTEISGPSSDDYNHSTHSHKKKHHRHRHAHKKYRKRLRHHKRYTKEVEQPAPMTPKELYKKLQVLNDFTRNPTQLTKKIMDPSENSERPKALAADSFPVVADDSGSDPFKNIERFNSLTDSRGVLHRPRSSSPFTKPGLWEPNPDDPHSRDPANKYWYHPESVGVDWLNGQLQWGAHWAVPAAGVGGTDGMSTLHFPSIGTFLNIPDDYD